MHTNDVQIDHERHKANRIDSKTHKKNSKATKLIPRPEITEISTKMQKCKKLNRICLEKNMEKQLASLERALKENNINNSQIEY